MTVPGSAGGGYQAGLLNGMALVLDVEPEDLVARFFDEVKMTPAMESLRQKVLA